MKLSAIIKQIFSPPDAADSGDDEFAAEAAAFRGRSSSSSIENVPGPYYYAPVDPRRSWAITGAVPFVEAVMLRVVPALVLAVTLGACGQKPADGATAAAGAADGTATADAPPPGPVEPPTVPPPPPAHPLEVGSQAAKDDLYCSAVIYAANPQ